MVLILENGSGVSGANAFVDPPFVTAYLTDRNRQTENGWTAGSGVAETAACIAAADYVEIAWGTQFKGQKAFRDISTARSTFTITGQPADTETVTVGTIVYQYVNTLATTNDVQIGASPAESIANLVDAINGNEGTAGTAFEASTVLNPDASANIFIGDALVVFASTGGTAGNLVVTTTTVVLGSWNFETCVGGSNISTPQPLSFARNNLFDDDGYLVVGIPDDFKFAQAEYAVRARVPPPLAQDPPSNASGGIVTRFKEVVGPIEEETEYLPGTAGVGRLQPYPAADRLLAQYIGSGSGSVIRG